jgi:hypothetical protein
VLTDEKSGRFFLGPFLIFHPIVISHELGESDGKCIFSPYFGRVRLRGQKTGSKCKLQATVQHMVATRKGGM